MRLETTQEKRLIGLFHYYYGYQTVNIFIKYHNLLEVAIFTCEKVEFQLGLQSFTLTVKICQIVVA